MCPLETGFTVFQNVRMFELQCIIDMRKLLNWTTFVKINIAHSKLAKTRSFLKYNRIQTVPQKLIPAITSGDNINL